MVNRSDAAAAISANMEETKVIYHIDDEDTPYLVKLPIAADKVTLADFKNVLNRPNYKFFFKSMDDDFGLVIRTYYPESTACTCSPSAFLTRAV